MPREICGGCHGRVQTGARGYGMVLYILGHFYEKSNTISCVLYLENGAFCDIVKKYLSKYVYARPFPVQPFDAARSKWRFLDGSEDL